MSDTSGGRLDVPQVRPTTSPRPWGTAVWVLAAAAAAAVLFVSGLVAGYVLGDRGGAPVGAPGPGSQGPPAGGGEAGTAEVTPGAQAPGAQPVVDGCVVGSWRTVEHEESFSTEQGTVSITGLVRQVDVGEDGRQVITYDGATATMSTAGSQGTAVYDGEVVYRVSTSGGTMSFELVSSQGTITMTPAEGAPQTEELRPGTGSVSYMCEGDRLTQEADGFRAVYERSA